MQTGPEAKQLTKEESDAMAGITSVDTSQIQPEVIEPIVVTDDVPPESVVVSTPSRNVRDILKTVSGNTYLKGRDKNVGDMTLDRSGLQALKTAAAEQQAKITEFIKLNKDRMSTAELNKQIETNFGTDLKELQAYQKREGNILSKQMAEDAKERGEWFSNREATSEDAYTRQQYGNLAQFFARLGTATPTSSGISGLLGAGLQAADETLPQAMQTRQDYDTRRDELASAKRSADKADKRISRTEEKAIRKDLYSGKKDLTKTKREKLKAAALNDIDIAKDALNAGNMSITIAGEVVDAETKLNAAQADLTLLDLKLNTKTDFGKVIPQYEAGVPALQRVIGGDVFEGLPANDLIKERAWSQAFNEVVAEIQSTDQDISQENLPQGTVLAAMLERAKDIIRQGKPIDPPNGGGDGGDALINTSGKALDKRLLDEND